MNIKIATIPKENFYDYRLNVIFDAYKWDLQDSEQSTISDKVVLLDQKELDFLSSSAVLLYNETIAMEKAIKSRPDLAIKMGISEEMTNALCNCDYNPNNHIRLMRFDFHPTEKGWKISEVNSDVPAGYPEASILPKLAEIYFNGFKQSANFGDILIDRFIKLTPPKSTIAFIHDTHTVEDYQILRFLGDLLEKRGYEAIYQSPANINWDNIGAIMRYFPVEWLEFEKDVDWKSFINTKIPSCNHPIALLTQSKRLPLIWDELNIQIPIWKKLLPKTICPSILPNEEGWILKPAFGRVGEGINIPDTISNEEDASIKEAANKDPLQWVAQKMFISKPIDGIHISLGVFVIDGLFAGLYARLSNKPKIDSDASEVPVLVAFSGGNNFE